MNQLKKNILFYGSEEAQADQIKLTAGPLYMIYECGQLRNIRYGNKEIVSRIYLSMRDTEWGTLLEDMGDFKLENGGDSFAITFTCVQKNETIDFCWNGRITGTSDGKIEFHVAGEAQQDFKTNRLGLCVLPSGECAGSPCEVGTIGGTRETGNLPSFFDPNLVFTNMQSLSYEVSPSFPYRESPRSRGNGGKC